MRGYREDLAYIHDAAFSGYTPSTSLALLELLARSGITGGTVLDLGCGSGRWARELTRAGYRVIGVDISPAMIALARKNAPRAVFEVAPLSRFRVPQCDAVTAIGECFNYCFDRDRTEEELSELFQRVYDGLRPGGVFVFDVAGPERVPLVAPRTLWKEARNWAILARTTGNAAEGWLVREMTCFRRVGSMYRRSAETHRQRLFARNDVLQALALAGFRARAMRSYGTDRLPDGVTAFVAVKPRPAVTSSRPAGR